MEAFLPLTLTHPPESSSCNASSSHILPTLKCQCFLNTPTFLSPGTALVSNYKDSLLFFNYSSSSKHQLKCYFLCNQEKNQSRSKRESWANYNDSYPDYIKNCSKSLPPKEDTQMTHEVYMLIKSTQSHKYSRKIKSKYMVPLSVRQNDDQKECRK